jgi:hypothetical protein
MCDVRAGGRLGPEPSMCAAGESAEPLDSQVGLFQCRNKMLVYPRW